MTSDRPADSQPAPSDQPGPVKLLVRNRVAEYAQWRTCFDEDLEPAAAYGLTLDVLWQDVDDPNNVFFIFDVRSIGEAEAFMARPESQEMGTKAGVLDGEFSFLVPAR